MVWARRRRYHVPGWRWRRETACPGDGVAMTGAKARRVSLARASPCPPAPAPLLSTCPGTCTGHKGASGWWSHDGPRKAEPAGGAAGVPRHRWWVGVSPQGLLPSSSFKDPVGSSWERPEGGRGGHHTGGTRRVCAASAVPQTCPQS